MNADGINRKLATGEYIITDKEGKAAVWGGKKKRKEKMVYNPMARLSCTVQ